MYSRLLPIPHQTRRVRILTCHFPSNSDHVWFEVAPSCRGADPLPLTRRSIRAAFSSRFCHHLSRYLIQRKIPDQVRVCLCERALGCECSITATKSSPMPGFSPVLCILIKLKNESRFRPSANVSNNIPRPGTLFDRTVTTQPQPFLPDRVSRRDKWRSSRGLILFE